MNKIIRYNPGELVAGVTIVSREDIKHEYRTAKWYVVMHDQGEHACGRESRYTHDGLNKRIKDGKTTFCKACDKRGSYSDGVTKTRKIGDRASDNILYAEAVIDMQMLDVYMPARPGPVHWCDRAAVRF